MSKQLGHRLAVRHLEVQQVDMCLMWNFSLYCNNNRPSNCTYSYCRHSSILFLPVFSLFEMEVSEMRGIRYIFLIPSLVRLFTIHEITTSLVLVQSFKSYYRVLLLNPYPLDTTFLVQHTKEDPEQMFGMSVIQYVAFGIYVA